MILEITKDERLIILRHLLAGTPLHDPQVTALANRLIEMRDANGTAVHLPLESHEPQGPAVPSSSSRKQEQLPLGVSSGRSQNSNQPQRTQESPAEPRKDWENSVVQERWTTAKFDSEAVEQITITPSKCERKDLKDGTPRMTISWQGKGRGYLYATVWDTKLMPWVASRKNKETMFNVVTKGKFTDVVGVKA